MYSTLRRACVLTASMTVAIGLAQPAAAQSPAADTTDETSAYGWLAALRGTGVPNGALLTTPAPLAAASGTVNTSKSERGRDFLPVGRVGSGLAESTVDSSMTAGGARGASALTEAITLFAGTPAELRIDSVGAGCGGRADTDGSGGFELRGAMLAGKPLPEHPAPNTRILVQSPVSDLPIGVLILNERIGNGDGSTTVQGARYVVNIPASVGGLGDPDRDTYAAGEVVLASATCPAQDTSVPGSSR